MKKNVHLREKKKHNKVKLKKKYHGILRIFQESALKMTLSERK